MKHVFVLNVPPIPWKRAGLRVNPGNPHFYDPQQKDKVNIGILLDRQRHQPIFTTALSVDMQFFFHTTKPKRLHKLTPDIDNLTKFLLDVMTGIIYEDDCQVSSLTAHKKYTKDESHTTIIITELE